jgi:hypothetical protein
MRDVAPLPRDNRGSEAHHSLAEKLRLDELVADGVVDQLDN